MNIYTTGRWLLVAFTLAALVFAVPVVSAHDGESTGMDAQPSDGTAEDWAAWMRAHMTDHMGADAIGWMEQHMGRSVDEMASQMAGSNMTGGSHC